MTNHTPTPRFVDLPPCLAAIVIDALDVIDVRGADEFNGELGHIADAQLIPLDTLEQSLPDLDRQRPLLVVCRSGKRSARAAARLADHGFAAVFNLDGGMQAWNMRSC
ncbi:MAG: sulfur dioxygenase [Myxococcota bacterium]|jgi:sulfur dioxygenase